MNKSTVTFTITVQYTHIHAKYTKMLLVQDQKKYVESHRINDDHYEFSSIT